MTEALTAAADALVIFGISGDLARKMTFPALYGLEAAGRLDCPIIGVAKDDWSAAHLVGSIRDALKVAGQRVEEKVFDRLAARFTYLQGDFDDSDTYDELARRLKGRPRPLFYLEILDAAVDTEQGGLTAKATVMSEKPFNHDLPSTWVLNNGPHQVLSEDQILRIDHF